MDVLFRPGPIIWVQELLGRGWEVFFYPVGLLGITWGILFAVALSLWLFGRRTAYALLGVVVVEAGVKMALNLVFAVPRPDAPGIVKYERVEGISSFPSGHVETVATVWGYLWARRCVPFWLVAAIVLAVSAGRVYLGTHYVADVVGAIAIGAAVVFLWVRVWPRLEGWLGERTFGFYVGLCALVLCGAVAYGALRAGDSPYKWRAVAFAIGAAIALPAEWRLVRYEPTGEARLRRFLIGTAGMLAALVPEQLAGQTSLWLSAVAVFLGTIWALLAAPALFALAGWSERAGPVRERTLAMTGKVLMVLLGLLAAVLVYGTAVEPRLILDTEEQTATVPGLPAPWDGRTVAVIADLQIGMWWANEGMVRKAVADIVERRPAAALIAGDLIYHPDERPGDQIGEAMALVRPLAEAGIPTYAVLGNHDWGVKTRSDSANLEAVRQLRDSLRAAGIPPVHNQALPLVAGGDTLWLVGIGSAYAGADSVEKALAGLPDGAPRIAFMHNPESFAEFPAGAAPFAVAAHTHGGQIRIPFLPEWSWLTFSSQDEVHADGWIDGYGAAGNRLYVNRGIGFSLVPVRINCPPEVTYFTLRGGTSPR